MKSLEKTTIDEKELFTYKDKIRKSGLFLLDNEDKPTGIFKLIGGTKELYTTKVWTIPKITDLALRVMINKLSRAILKYLSGPSGSINWPQELQEDFRSDLLQLLNNYALHESKLKPRFSEFITKANLEIKKLNEGYNPKGLTEKQWRFSQLIRHLYAIFDKYLIDLEKKESQVNQNNIFHYIAHLLIACGIENRDSERGHWPVFEKIKRYAYRSGHINYMGRAKPL